MEIDPHHRRSDLRLIERAIRNKWKFPEKTFEELPELVADVAHNEEVKPEVRLMAAGVLLKMNAQNMQMDKEAGPDYGGRKPPSELHLHQHQHAHIGSNIDPLDTAIDFETRRQALLARIDTLGDN